MFGFAGLINLIIQPLNSLGKPNARSRQRLVLPTWGAAPNRPPVCNSPLDLLGFILALPMVRPAPPARCATPLGKPASSPHPPVAFPGHPGVFTLGTMWATGARPARAVPTLCFGEAKRHRAGVGRPRSDALKPAACPQAR